MLYSIAVDLVKKRSVQASGTGVKEYVCVLITKNNSIFTGTSGTTVGAYGETARVCAEDKAISIMSNAGESCINALVVVDCQTLLPCTPCDACKKRMLETNPENAGCYVMKEDRSFVKLSELPSRDDSVWDVVWDTGWDDSDANTGAPSPSGNVFSPNGGTLGFSPVPNTRPAGNSVDSVSNPYHNLVGINPDGTYLQNPNTSSTLQATAVRRSNSTFAQQQSIAREASESNRFKERLRGIMGDDTLGAPVATSVPKPTPTTTTKPHTKPSTPVPKKVKEPPKSLHTRKELKSLAKERKRQAKKNVKIIESIEKRSNQ